MTEKTQIRQSRLTNSQIDEKLDVSMRADWLKMRSGIYVQKSRRIEIIEEVRSIVNSLYDGEINLDLSHELDDDFVPKVLSYYWDNDELYIEVSDESFLNKLVKLSFSITENKKILNVINSESREVYLKLRDGLTPTNDDIQTLVLELFERELV